MADKQLHILLARAGGGGSAINIPFHPAPSIGHEIGVMFGGIGAMMLGKVTSLFHSMDIETKTLVLHTNERIGAVLFWVWWKYNLARELRQEEDRVRSLKRKGLFDEDRRMSAINENELMMRRENSLAG